MRKSEHSLQILDCSKWWSKISQEICQPWWNWQKPVTQWTVNLIPIHVTHSDFAMSRTLSARQTVARESRKYGRTKQVQRRKLCLHLHYVMLARRLKGEKIDLQSDSASAGSSAFSSLEHPTTSKPDQSNELVVMTAVDSGRRSTDKKLWHLDLEGLSETRAAALKVQMKRLIPYQIPLEILQWLGSSDAASHLRERKEDCAWPNSFSPSESMCCLCHNPLGPPVIPQGRDADGHSYLLTNLNPFRRVEILVRKCQNKRCKAVHHLFPYQLGRCWSCVFINGFISALTLVLLMVTVVSSTLFTDKPCIVNFFVFWSSYFSTGSQHL